MSAQTVQPCPLIKLSQEVVTYRNGQMFRKIFSYYVRSVLSIQLSIAGMTVKLKTDYFFLTLNSDMFSLRSNVSAFQTCCYTNTTQTSALLNNSKRHSLLATFQLQILWFAFSCQ